MTGSEVAITLSSSAATAADVGEGEADELKGLEVEDGKAVAEVAMTLASSLVTGAAVLGFRVVDWKRKSRVSLLLLMVTGGQALSLKPRASETELVTQVCSSGLPWAFKVRTKE